MEVALPILFIGLLIFIAHLLSALFSRTQVPDVLFLIGIGIMIGPVLKLVSPADFGAVGPVFSTVALVLILFEGGIDLHVSTLRRAVKGTLALTVLSYSATLVAVSLMAHYLMGFDWVQAALLGSILGAISPAVVIPLTRQLRMSSQAKAILYLESALSDVLCIVVTLELIAAYETGGIKVASLLGHTLLAPLIALVLGALGALVWAAFLTWVRSIENTNFTTLAMVFVVFGLTEWMGLSGPIASLVFGLTLGNINAIRLPHIYHFVVRDNLGLSPQEKTLFTEVVFLLKTFFFVYVGMSVLVYDIRWISYGVLITLAIFVLRVPIVRLSIDRLTPRFDASLMAVMVSKGLAAAVMASLPAQAGIPQGDLIQTITYTVITASIFLTASLSFLISRTPVGRFYGLFFIGFGPRGIEGIGLSPVADSSDIADG